MEHFTRESKILALLDKLPSDVLMQYILPNLAPETLVWLNKTNYITYHSCIFSLLRKRPNYCFPLGKWETYVRHMIRDDCAFVIQQLLNDNGKKWMHHRNYRYKNCTYPTYLHFAWAYSTDFVSSRCRKLIFNKGIELMGRNWYKKRREKFTKWTN